MSELKVDKVSPRTGNYVALNTVGSKNIIINGDMSIAQRSTSVASITTGGYYTVDRWTSFISSLGTWTQSQSTDVPTGEGFSKSLKWDCTTADASPAASDRMLVQQRIETSNLIYLKKGTSNALSLTASFWVKSNKTGTYIVELFDVDNTRQISKAYTINSANTWEKKTITFEGDTTGVIGANPANSFNIQFWLGAGTDFTSGTLATSWGASVSANRAVGQVNLADNTANDWYITGVQLEAGTTASDFEFLPVDVNLQRCQRYFEKSNNLDLSPGDTDADGYVLFNFIVNASNQNYIPVRYSVTKRNEPTVTFYSVDTGASGKYRNFTDATDQDATVARSGDTALAFRPSSNTGVNANDIAGFHFTADAEL